MGQTSSTVKSQKNTDTDTDTYKRIDFQLFENSIHEKQRQLKQQLELVEKASIEVQTSTLQIKELIEIENKYHQVINRKDLKNYYYNAEGFFIQDPLKSKMALPVHFDLNQ
jgi:DNA repair ATPase RecN